MSEDKLTSSITSQLKPLIKTIRPVVKYVMKI